MSFLYVMYAATQGELGAFIRTDVDPGLHLCRRGGIASPYPYVMAELNASEMVLGFAIESHRILSLDLESTDLLSPVAGNREDLQNRKRACVCRMPHTAPCSNETIPIGFAVHSCRRMAASCVSGNTSAAMDEHR